MIFVKLTATAGDPIWIHLDLVASIRRFAESDLTRLYYAAVSADGDADPVDVTETPSEIFKLASDHPALRL